MARATRASKPTLAAFQLPLLEAEQFTATRFDTTQAKADFGNQLLAFIAEGFPHKRFTQRFYRVLMQHFGMMAHYDQHRFWGEFFTTTADQVRFLEEITSHPCWGDPAFTFSDLERAVIARLGNAGLVARLRTVLDHEIEAAERALLNRLQARYQPEKASVAELPRSRPAEWAADQPSLF
jgi:hypothetical protein